MKPIAVFRHSPNVEPGYFASFLDRHSLPWRLIAIDEQHPVPRSAEEFSGICLMGGPMSANDDLPWIKPLLALIRQAVSLDIPVIGHCLGGQLMCKALGGTVSRAPVKEIGWGSVRSEQNDEARTWLGEIDELDVYQWHGETFSLPTKAVRILRGEYCANQAYVIGPHLGMQFHIEMTEALIRTWNADWASEFARAAILPPTVQAPAEQFARLPSALPRMRSVADKLYTHWTDEVRTRHSR